MIDRKHTRCKRLKLRAIVTGFSKMKLYKCEFCYNSKAFAQDNNGAAINAQHMSLDCSFNCTCFKNVNYHSRTQTDNIFCPRLKLLTLFELRSSFWSDISFGQLQVGRSLSQGVIMKDIWSNPEELYVTFCTINGLVALRNKETKDYLFNCNV